MQQDSKRRRQPVTEPVAVVDAYTADRIDRHSDMLSQVVFDRLGAEMRGFAECANTYFETLTQGPFTRGEALELTQQYTYHWWDQQAALRGG